MAQRSEERNLIGRLSAGSLHGRLNSETGMLGGLSVPKTSIVKDYNILVNKPKIENVELMGNRHMVEFGVETLSNLDIEAIINNFI